MEEKRPRDYTAGIIALDNREARSQALQAVPEYWREWVRFYVTDHFAKRAALKKRNERIKQQGQTARDCGHPITDCPYDYDTPASEQWRTGWHETNNRSGSSWADKENQDEQCRRSTAR